MEIEQTVVPKGKSLTYTDLINAYREIGKTKYVQQYYYNNYIAPTPPMDEFETRIMQERIKTCRGRLTVDEYYKYCREIDNTYTNASIKGSKLCQVLFNKRPAKYTPNGNTRNIEHYVRKKPQWTHLNTR